MDLELYEQDLAANKFVLRDFQMLISFVETNLKNDEYYLDYLTKLTVIEELVKNESKIKTHVGFHCQTPSINGNSSVSYHQLDNIIDQLFSFNIISTPAKHLGGGAYIQIVDIEKFYKFICYETRQIVKKIKKNIPQQNGISSSPLVYLFDRIDPNFSILEEWLSNNDPNDFEKGVDYLLSLLGFNSVHVGGQFEIKTMQHRRKEHLKSAIGLDLIAAHDNIVIICQCSTDLNYRKIVEISDIYQEIKDKLEDHNNYKVLPLIVTTVSKSKIESSIVEAKTRGISILTKENIQYLLQLIKSKASLKPQSLLDNLA